MAVAASQTWTMTMDEIVDAAYARIGGEQVSGYEAKVAIRNLNLLFQFFQSRRVALWTIERRNFEIIDLTQSFTLPPEVIDIVNAVTRINPELTTRSDIPCTRFSRDDWVNLPNKNSWGRPMNYWLDRQRDAPVVTLWPLNRGVYMQFVYYAVVRSQDSLRLRDNVDAPVRWLPAVISGLALYLGRERAAKTDPIAEVVRQRLPDLEATFEKDFDVAWDEDRDSAPLTIEADVSSFYRI